jgi:hypothetical protein
MHRLFARVVQASLLLFSAPVLVAQQAPRWVGTWAASPMGAPVNFGQPSPANTTYRNVVRISAGGATVRIELTNEFGTRPLAIGAAHIAVSAGMGAIQPGSDHARESRRQRLPPGPVHRRNDLPSGGHDDDLDHGRQ